jgi:hypothetical protein
MSRSLPQHMASAWPGVTLSSALLTNEWLVTERIDEIQTIESLASGEITEQEFADWLRTNCRKYIPQT